MKGISQHDDDKSRNEQAEFVRLKPRDEKNVFAGEKCAKLLGAEAHPKGKTRAENLTVRKLEDSFG